MSYNEWIDGYAIEVTFKDTDLIDSADDTAYKLGTISQQSVMPSATMIANFPPTAVSKKEVTAGTSWTKPNEYRGMLGIVLQNGIPIWLAMGKHTDSEDGGVYTHTIVPTDDGALLPSIVLHHEEKGSATNEQYQWRGVKVDSLLLLHDRSEQGANCLMGRLEVQAASEADPAVELTNAPALPSTSNAAPYSSLTRTWDYGSGNVAINGLQKVEIVIANGLMARKDADGTVYAFTEWPRKQYRINLWMALNTVERTMWDDKVAKTNTKELYFKWTRSTNDYIECTATNCNITAHSIVSPPTGPARIEATLEPEALSFTVKDSINGNPHYGDAA